MRVRTVIAVAALLVVAVPAAVAQAAATPTVSELTGGVTSGFTPNSFPDAITVGPDGHIWFTEFEGPGASGQLQGKGAVGRVNDDGSVSELVGGVTSGFDPYGGPEAITTGPDGRIWFGAALDPGWIGEVIDGKASGFTGGQAGFAANTEPASGPDSITTSADGHIWFTQYNDPGRLGEVFANHVHELIGGVTSGFSPNRGPAQITTGPDGRLWFSEKSAPGGIARVNDDGTVTELTGGATSGFRADTGPQGITTGPDGHIWFVESRDPGAIARVNDDGTVTEFRAGATPGFTPNNDPGLITTGPDGHLWFTEYGDGGLIPGRIARLNDDGTVSEFTSGVTPGFSPGAGPTGITSGPDGRVWFAEYGRGGIGAISVGPAVATGGADGLGASTATLEGSVRPNGQQTVYRFEYGPTTAYGLQTPLSPAGSAVAAAPVSAALTGLQPGTVYHYRLVATNDTDTTIGHDQTFTTSPGASVAEAAPGDIQPPGAPGALHGRYRRGSLVLSWRAASDNVGVARYRLYRNGVARATIPGGSTRVVLRGFRTRHRTVFALRAFDAAGNAGPDSDALIVTPVRRAKGRRARYHIVSAPITGGRLRPAALPQQSGVVDLATQANVSILGGGGATVAPAGDVNGDGLADVILGAPGRGAYVVFGKPSPGTVDLGSLGHGGFRIAGVDGPIAAAGDVNGDGFSDLLLGAAGATYVVFGGPSLRAVDLAALGDGGIRIGGATQTRAAGAGDVNGDGFDDVIVGAGNAGYVVFGKPDAAPIDLTALGAGGFRMSAASRVSAVAGAGDLNGDGRADLIVGATPEVYVVFGRASSAPVDLSMLGSGGFAIDGAADLDQPGFFSVAGAGDVNGDGRADVIVGQGGVTHDFPDAGSAYVVFGKSTPDPVDVTALGSRGFSIEGVGENARAGGSVAGAGDVNGDGLADLIVGAQYADGLGRADSGAAYVVFGKRSTTAVDLGSLGSQGFVMAGAAALDSAGTSVAGAGDVNGDGRPDVIVGALAPSTTNNVGLAYVVYGFGSPALAYSPLTATVGTPLAPVGPALLRRTGAASFTVFPALPSGLTLDPATGTISGTPQAVQANSVYEVTMSDLTGPVTAPLAVQVSPAPTTTMTSTSTPTAPARALTLVVSGRRRQRLLRQGAVRVSGSCDEACTLSVTGTVRIAGTTGVSLRRSQAALSAPGTTTLRLAVSRAARRRLARLLSAGRRGDVTVTVRARDAAGHAVTSKFTITVLR
jgi:streptogramin lyase